MKMAIVISHDKFNLNLLFPFWYPKFYQFKLIGLSLSVTSGHFPPICKILFYSINELYLL